MCAVTLTVLPPNIIPVGLFLGAHIKYALLYALCNWYYRIYSNTPRNYTSVNVSSKVYFYAYKMLILPYALLIGPLSFLQLEYIAWKFLRSIACRLARRSGC